MTLRFVSAIVALALTGVALSGCAGAPTRFYALDPIAPSPGRVGAYAGPPLRVDAVNIPPAYDRIELVREVSAGRIEVGDNDHWAAPLGDLMRRTLTQDLVARLPAGSVVFPDSPKPAGASGLSIDILAISRGGGSIGMDFSWTITRSRTADKRAASSPIAVNQDRITVPATDSGLAGAGADISTLLGAAADRIAADLSQ